MRIVVLLIALVIVVLGGVGVVAPDTVMAMRREYVAIPRGVYTVGAIRVALGVLLILVASTSRMPKPMRVLGVLVCAQGLIPNADDGLHARATGSWRRTSTSTPATSRAPDHQPVGILSPADLGSMYLQLCCARTKESHSGVIGGSGHGSRMPPRLNQREQPTRYNHQVERRDSSQSASAPSCSMR
jgi:hypothetical protein